LEERPAAPADVVPEEAEPLCRVVWSTTPGIGDGWQA